MGSENSNWVKKVEETQIWASSSANGGGCMNGCDSSANGGGCDSSANGGGCDSSANGGGCMSGCDSTANGGGCMCDSSANGGGCMSGCDIISSRSDSCSMGGLPLTFLDIPWLLFPPTKPLFFFQLDDDDDDDLFTTNILPKLKNSLSSALRHFYPLASTLHHHHHDNHLQFSFTTCSIPLTVAVSHLDISHLCTNQPRDASIFQLLVPHLPTLTLPTTTTSPTPLFSVQITHFPIYNSNPPAFSIGFSSHPLLCDQRTFYLFLTTWSSFSKLSHPPPPPFLPSFDRSPIIDPTSTDLHSILLNHCLSSHSLPLSTTLHSIDMLRSTFVITPTHIHNTRLWIMARSDHSHTPYPALLSPYVVTCAIVWACFAQLQYHSNPKLNASPSMYMGFIAGGITRLPYPVPTNYFGNCVAFGRAVAKREDLLLLPHGDLDQNELEINGSDETCQKENDINGKVYETCPNENDINGKVHETCPKENDINGKAYENGGILAAAHAISKAIKDLDADVLGQAHNWILDWEPIIGWDQHINMVGSPKVELYEIDFGWGRPKKIEEISIDGMRGRGVSLMQSRDVKGGIEIGVTLPTSTMHTFSFLFNQTLAFMSPPFHTF